MTTDNLCLTLLARLGSCIFENRLINNGKILRHACIWDDNLSALSAVLSSMLPCGSFALRACVRGTLILSAPFLYEGYPNVMIY